MHHLSLPSTEPAVSDYGLSAHSDRRPHQGGNESLRRNLEVPQLVAECFDQILASAAAIADPFEQAFFAMVQLPCLQPFDDVNKRVSRLAANIPLIKENLSPLSFEDVPRDLYTEAVLGVYELRRVELLRDVFIWACERSAARYAAVRQSLGEPDPFRMRHRSALREVVGAVVRERMNKKQATVHVSARARELVDEQERPGFSRSPRENSLDCTEATSRATASGHRSSRRGRSVGAPEGHSRTCAMTAGSSVSEAAATRCVVLAKAPRP